MLFPLTALALAATAWGYVSEQVSVNYGASPDQMVITWAEYKTSDTEHTVIYGSDPDNLNMSTKGSGVTYTVGDYVSPMLYKATISDLAPGNKKYFYSINSASGFSEVMWFKTHPGVGVEDVTVHVIGDIGQTTNSQNTLQQVLDCDNDSTGLSGGILCVGDLSYADNNQPMWDSFANMKQFVASQIPFMTTTGNHEWFEDDYSFAAYLARYNNPPVPSGSMELYYSYDVGLAHFIMVSGYCSEMHSTSSQPCLAEGSPEMDWLQQDLASVDLSVTPWVFVVFHQPYVNSNQGHSMETEGAPMKDAIEDVLYQSGIVDAVLSGHVHAYERSYRVYNYELTDDAPFYITIGDGGNHEGLYDYWIEPQPEWSAYRAASYGHGELRIINSTHCVWQWHQNHDLYPQVADEVWITKTQEKNLKSKSLSHQTGRPQFVNSERGERARQFNEEAKKRAEYSPRTRK